jgi:hypothetical protein
MANEIRIILQTINVRQSHSEHSIFKSEIFSMR